MEEIFAFKNINLKETSILTLAYMGDAIHTLLVRKNVLESGVETPNNLHKISSKYCSAKGQAEKLEQILPNLTNEENDLVRRTRNTKTHNPPKNCDLEVYKKATCFEVLIGYLYITKNYQRMKQLKLLEL